MIFDDYERKKSIDGKGICGNAIVRTYVNIVLF